MARCAKIIAIWVPPPRARARVHRRAGFRARRWRPTSRCTAKPSPSPPPHPSAAPRLQHCRPGGRQHHHLNMDGRRLRALRTSQHVNAAADTESPQIPVVRRDRTNTANALALRDIRACKSAGPPRDPLGASRWFRRPRHAIQRPPSRHRAGHPTARQRLRIVLRLSPPTPTPRHLQPVYDSSSSSMLKLQDVHAHAFCHFPCSPSSTNSTTTFP